MKEVIMLSGLPRSGSTVLSSLLNQHPLIYATTTSPVADLVTEVVQVWPNISRAIMNPHPQQTGNIIEGIMQGAHQHEEKPIIVDKNRLWPRLAPTIAKISNKRLKIICTVRDIPDIMASYILLFTKNLPQPNFVDNELVENKLAINNRNRCKLLLEKYIGHPYNSLKIGYNSESADLLFIDYEEIIRDGQEVMNRICDFIEIDSSTIDINNLKPMDENDYFHGGIRDLHLVRPELKKTSPSAEEVIGKDLVKYYRDMKLHFWKK